MLRCACATCPNCGVPWKTCTVPPEAVRLGHQCLDCGWLWGHVLPGVEHADPPLGPWRLATTGQVYDVQPVG